MPPPPAGARVFQRHLTLEVHADNGGTVEQYLCEPCDPFQRICDATPR